MNIVYRLPFIALSFLTLFASSTAFGHGTHNHSHKDKSAHSDLLPRFQFNADIDAMRIIDKALAQAKNNDKLALIVLGANWCHDSVGLARRFATPELYSVIDKGFETAFISVGYLEDKSDITRRFGQANYFATPTVMIVDPTNETLLNKASLKKWSYADSVPVDEYISYFSKFAADTSAELVYKEDAQIKQIDNFARLQSVRLASAYRMLGPKLKADEDGHGDGSFLTLWKEVKLFRMSLQSDLVSLYQTAAKNQNNGTKEPLVMPSYGPFSWE